MDARDQARALIAEALRGVEIPLNVRACLPYGALADAVLALFEVDVQRECHHPGMVHPVGTADATHTHTRLVLRTAPQPAKEDTR